LLSCAVHPDDLIHFLVKNAAMAQHPNPWRCGQVEILARWPQFK
jgi:hypothetical protein